MLGLYELYQCPYYWGEMKREDAIALFDKKPDGCFLVFYNSERVNFEMLMKLPTGPIFSSSALKSESIVKEVSSLCQLFGVKSYPIIRNRAFSLKELSRAQIRKTDISFEAISELECPELLKKFLQEYHVQE